MKHFAKLLCISTISWASIAIASDEGIYLGINAVYGKLDLSDTTVNHVTYTPSDENSFGGGITAGYNTSQHFGLETAFDGLNKVDYDGNDAPSQSYWFTYLAAKPMLPIWKFNTYLRLGAAYVHIDQNNPGSAQDTTTSEVRPMGGVGIGFNFSPNTELDISYNRIQDTDNPITFGMLTLTYHFVTRYEESGFLAD